MGKVENYRKTLRSLDKWDEFLLRESNLPGPRANLELAYAVGAEGDSALFERYASLDPEAAPENTQAGFLAVCGALGLGYSVAAGDAQHLPRLRLLAADSRWRVREAVALGLQEWGKVDMDNLIEEMDKWSDGNLLEQRAVVAALCEPALLHKPDQAQRVFDLLDKITSDISLVEEHKSDGFRALRKTLGYGWSVAVAAQPEIGKERMGKWIQAEDKTIRWIMKENLKKKRLARMEPAWVDAMLGKLK